MSAVNPTPRNRLACARCHGSGVEPDLSHLATITYADIRRKTDLSWSMISRMFSDNPAQRRVPSLKTAKKVADALNVTLDLFYDITEGKAPKPIATTGD